MGNCLFEFNFLDHPPPSTHDSNSRYFCFVSVVDQKPYLLDVKFLDEVNHQTVSAAIISTVNAYGISPLDVISFVSDNAAYCKKAYNTVLQHIYPHSTHICCLAHILQLVGEVFHVAFQELSQFASYFKSAFYKKGARKRRYQKFLESKGLPTTLAPVPSSTRWNSFFNAAVYHTSHLNLYLEFFELEKERCRSSDVSIAVDRIVSMLSSDVKKLEVEFCFVATECTKIARVLDSFQGSTQPLSLTAWSKIEEIDLYLHKGTAKVVFAPELEALLAKIPVADKAKHIRKFHETFNESLMKFSKHLDVLPARGIYQQARVFDPKQAPNLSRDIDEYSAIHFRDSDPLESGGAGAMLREEWDDYHHFIQSPIGQQSMAQNPTPMAFWRDKAEQFPMLSATALMYMSVPVSSCDAERSFSLYKHLFNDRRESNTQEHVKMLVMMNFNGDISRQLMLTTRPEMR